LCSIDSSKDQNFILKSPNVESCLQPQRTTLFPVACRTMGSHSDGCGSKIFDSGWVGSIFLWLGLGRIGPVIYGFGLNLENFP